MTAKQATILASQVRMLKSAHTGRKYRITISLPYAYSRSRGVGWPFEDPPVKWPVVYLLDANWYFGMVTDIVRSMAWWGGTIDAVVVGIGYPEAADPQEAWLGVVRGRHMDYLPVRDESTDRWVTEKTRRPTITGDAGRFLQFIKNELIPWIEKEYNAEPSRRILAGHSSGGMFAAYALLEEPGLFESYISNSPDFVYGDRYVFRQEAAFAKKHKGLKARVYLSAGDLEESPGKPTLSDMHRFAALLESRSYKGLTLARQVFANVNHCEVIAPGFQAGLQWALRK